MNAQRLLHKTIIHTLRVHAHIHVHEKNQGGVRQAIAPWTVVVSLLTLIGREYVKTSVKHHNIICTSTLYM